jgi:hypothetical protein
MLLADSAQAVGGKLFILGGGWSLTGPAPSPSALALKFEVPWDRANHRYDLLIELVDADGVPVVVPGTDQPIRIESTLEAGRPPGLKLGTPLDAVIALNFSPLPLEPDKRYEWRLTIDGQHEEAWSVAFGTRPDGGGGEK